MKVITALFWLPGMGKSRLSKFYLNLRGRPHEGLDTFHPVIPWLTRKYARDAGFIVLNIKRLQIFKAARRKMPFLKFSIMNPILWSIYFLWDFYKGIVKFGKSEATIAYLLIKE